ncbi:hypothetical protein ALIPUT_01074 [Alistipes putredinis DSM 17216]|uniref:Uncharacterized protein n=2 Tax=Bacteroidales TaxID=171549 RepID=B0MVC8_9BACT|nr:hypothetical protein ALIPUT_01074 [Alistipes putredinis DSM 17216]
MDMESIFCRSNVLKIFVFGNGRTECGPKERMRRTAAVRFGDSQRGDRVLAGFRFYVVLHACSAVAVPEATRTIVYFEKPLYVLYILIHTEKCKSVPES